ncbi:MAG: hypothetical protein V3V09_06105, partial [Arenicellales bacterium]
MFNLRNKKLLPLVSSALMVALLWLGMASSATNLSSSIQWVASAHAQTVTQAGAQYQLTGITPKQLTDGSAVIDLKFSGGIPNINHFLMVSPPRVIIDLPHAA